MAKLTAVQQEIPVEQAASIFSETIKVATYGAPSSGKTLQISHLIERYGAENVAIISRERGLNTIRSSVQAMPHRIQVVEPAEGLNVADGMRAAWAWASKTVKPGQWLCVDGGTRITEDLHQEVFGTAEKCYAALLSGAPASELPGDLRAYAVFVTKQQELNTAALWGKLKKNAERLFNSFVTLPCNLYWTFWEDKPSPTFGTPGIQFQPDAPGKGARDAIMGTFDYIVRLVPNGVIVTDGKARPQFKAVCQPTPIVFARTRNDLRGGIDVPAEINDFRLDQFIDLIAPTNQPTINE